MSQKSESNEKFSWVHWTDGVLALAAALIAYFKHKEELAAIFALFGSLIVVSRLIFQNTVDKEIRLLKEQIKENLDPLEQIKKLIDIQQTSRIGEISELLKLYLSITEKEFRQVKDTVVMRASAKLQQLAIRKVSDDLTTSEYYQWLLPMMEDTVRGEKIRAISVMHPSEWDESPAERQFLQQNINAAQRGVIVERIFIVTDDILEKAHLNRAIQLHLQDVNNGLNGFIVNRKWLASHDIELLKQADEGFLILATRVALVDKFTPTGEARGQVTMDPGEISRLIDVFDRLKTSSDELESLASLEAQREPQQISGNVKKLLTQ